MGIDRKSTRLNSSHTVIYTLSLHDALPISPITKVAAMTRLMSIPMSPATCWFCAEPAGGRAHGDRSEEHTSELQSHRDLHSFPTRRSSDLADYEGRGDDAVDVDPHEPGHLLVLRRTSRWPGSWG